VGQRHGHNGKGHTINRAYDIYRDCARELLSKDDVERMLNLMHRLEEVPNLAEVMEILTFKGESLAR
jgi:hypothetical protein